MQDRTNKLSNQRTNNVDTTLTSKLKLLSVAPAYESKKEESEYTMLVPLPRKMCRLSHQSTTVQPTKTVKKQATLNWCNQVMVFEIPSRDDYSSQAKSRMWRGLEEIRTNANRNYREFESEGGEWRKAAEEEEFVFDDNKGEWRHPCWSQYHTPSCDQYSSDEDE